MLKATKPVDMATVLVKDEEVATDTNSYWVETLVSTSTSGMWCSKLGGRTFWYEGHPWAQEMLFR